jgi:hypothetical protein
MNLALEDYRAQLRRWPTEGQHILAQYDSESIVVYQAYTEAIGEYAVANGRLGGPGFSLNRMSWIKPNFLWTMYRSGWGTKEAQEAVLAIRLTRAGFDQILALAVRSSFSPKLYSTHEEWKHALASSEVRLQWDPDHDPAGNKYERRAIQLGLRGTALRRFVEEWTIEIQSMKSLVAEQRELRADPQKLITPREDVYPVLDPTTPSRVDVAGKV